MLIYTLPSRFCLPDMLRDEAWPRDRVYQTRAPWVPGVTPTPFGLKDLRTERVGTRPGAAPCPTSATGLA